MEMKVTNVLLSFFAVISFVSCSDNQIYFDPSEQSIKTCNGTVIRNLYVSDLTSGRTYRFEKLQDMEGTNNFSLISMNKNYRLELTGSRLELDLKSFHLSPVAKYRISNHTNGDAASAEIEITTDDNGMINTADITSCK